MSSNVPSSPERLTKSLKWTQDRLFKKREVVIPELESNIATIMDELEILHKTDVSNERRRRKTLERYQKSLNRERKLLQKLISYEQKVLESIGKNKTRYDRQQEVLLGIYSKVQDGELTTERISMDLSTIELRVYCSKRHLKMSRDKTKLVRRVLKDAKKRAKCFVEEDESTSSDSEELDIDSLTGFKRQRVVKLSGPPIKRQKLC